LAGSLLVSTQVAPHAISPVPHVDATQPPD
jgi:hypothetical protein